MNRKDRRKFGRILSLTTAGVLGSTASSTSVGASPTADSGSADTDEAAAPTGTRVHSTTITIPERTHRNGPITRSRQRRAFMALGAIEAIGLGLSLVSKSKKARAAGLGVMVPGAGFAYTKDPVRGAISAGSAALGLVLWIGSGNHLATPLAWFGGAALAGKRASSIEKPLDLMRLVVPASVAVAGAVVANRTRKDFKKQQSVAAQTNAYLETFVPPLRGEDRPEPYVGEELTRDELLLARKLISIALQDDDDWSNFEIIEQFQPTAIRYQINNLGWALSLLQYSRMPAFHGYLSEAQRRLIDKYQQRKVWSYWWLENIWGNLEINPDPVRKQNVMLSGWYGLQLATYQSATGDLRYTEPDSIRFRWDDKKEYRYSLSSICDAMIRDISASEWTMIVCEPNWLYPVCNTTAGSAFRIHDRMLGTNYWNSISSGFTRTVDEELHRVDGTSQMFKSTRTGYGNGAIPAPSVELRPLIPELADRGWALTKAGVWATDETGSTGTIFRNMPEGFDYGNVGISKVVQYGGVIEAAREAGDEDLAQAAWNELFETLSPSRDDNELTFPDASLMAHAAIGRAAFTRKGGWLDLIERGLPEAWNTGPLLADVIYSEAMVARAHTDGSNLEFVLYPVESDIVTEVALARLTPNTEYAVLGAGQESLTADSEGNAALTIDLRGRTKITIQPNVVQTATK